jgi:parallel beta-helix repeat protein
MRKSMMVFAFLTALCCAVSSAAENPRTPRVLIVAMPTAGSPANSGAENGSNQNPFTTIQAAVDAASPGDTIRVKKGVYRNPGFGTSETNGPVVLIKKGGDAKDGILTLQGEPGAVIEFDGSGGILGAKNVSYVTIKNFVVKGPAAGISQALALQHRLDNPTKSKYSGEGISFPGPSDHIEVLNNEVMDACGSGVRVDQGDYIGIQENKVSNSTGCSASASSALVIAQATNVDVADTVKIKILNNTVFNNRNNLPFYAPNGLPPGAGPRPFPSYGMADSTRIIDGSGIYLTRNNKFYAHGEFLIENNVAYGNGINGVAVQLTDNVTLKNNTIANNGTVPLCFGRQKNSGLAINRSKHILIFNNRVQVNVAGDTAIKVFGEVSRISASGNQYAGGSSDLKVGVAKVPVFWFGPAGSLPSPTPSPGCPTAPPRPTPVPKCPPGVKCPQPI